MAFFKSLSGADWLIAGLGNPEPKYDGTRHNTGFAALDYLADRWGVSVSKAKWQGLYGTAQVDGRKVVLLKPLTYMNLSGQSIAPAANFLQDPRRPCDRAVRRHRPEAGAYPHPAVRLGRRAQRAEKHHRQPWRRRLLSGAHRGGGEAQPPVRPGRLGAGQVPAGGRQGRGPTACPTWKPPAAFLMDGKLAEAQKQV